MRHHSADLYLSTAIGGAIGASARYGMELAVPPAQDGWPTATFVVNLSGCLLLGFVLVIAKELAPDPHRNLIARRLRPFVITGVLGGYTTFSTYAMETRTLLRGPTPITGVAYAIGSVVAGVLCVALAMMIGESMARRARKGRVTLATDVQAVEAAEAIAEEEA